ncbi:RNA polymerase sigma factor [Pedobacter xixiisoli]|uniref:RNA polymerase sigma-70 factor, ECF subfamily n=1 Tax=Pedobacter xixiisoli TaxID=1476464 RepID=A0A285ZW12_9SPHI|nr:RNA polymerase sigma-70 factor [Pedobacter xixiisoli]SOD13830.1 RNA polymerase sigma-70 factor, ECF subfamily [Pedobacter xixiisoli]
MYSFQTLSIEQIKGFREGSETAFREIYVHFSPRIYRFAFSYLKGKQQSEEIVQETFLALLENRLKFEQSRALEPYLFTIAKRLILDQLRKVVNTKAFKEKLLNTISDQHNETEERIVFSDLLVFAESAIDELPLQQQTVFRLSRVEGLSYDEIAERLNLSRNTVKNHLMVAVKKLKNRFNNQEMIYLVFLMSIYF